MENTSNSNLSKREKSQKSIAQIVISAMMLALALALEGISKCIPFFSWPLGGSISLTMVPLILCALYCGPVYGTIIAMCFGGINFLFDGVISWTGNVTAVLLSLLLDYLIGFGVCGLASLFRKPFFEKKSWSLIASASLCGIARLVSSFLSGVIVFTNAFDYESTSGLAVDFSWGGITYSLGYNAGYMLPSIALDVLVLLVLVKPLFLSQKLPVVRSLSCETITTEKEKKFPSFQSLLPFYLVAEYVFAILSTIVPLYLSFFGYFALALGVGFLTYEIVYLVKGKETLTRNEKILCYSYIALILVGIAVSLAGVFSPISYGKDAYTDHFKKD